MKLFKKDLVLLSEFVDSGNPKIELSYILVKDECLFATDTRRAIKFHLPQLKTENLLCHKKLLKGFIATMGKEDVAEVVEMDEICLKSNDAVMNLSTSTFEHKYPDSERIIEQKLPYHFVLANLNDINFELTKKSCYIDSYLLLPLVKHGENYKFDVFYKPQGEKDTGLVKIVASRSVDEEEVVLYTAVIMGREFKSSAVEE